MPSREMQEQRPRDGIIGRFVPSRNIGIDRAEHRAEFRGWLAFRGCFDASGEINVSGYVEPKLLALTVGRLTSCAKMPCRIRGYGTRIFAPPSCG